MKVNNIYFYLPEYPDCPTGGLKYHKIVYEYFLKRFKKVFIMGSRGHIKYIDRNKLLKVLFGIYYVYKAKRNSIIILSNTSFLHFLIPMILNKLYKNHFYFMIVHHLIRNENPEFFRRTLEKFFIKNSDYIMTVSKTTRNEMISHGIIKDKDVAIISPGLDQIKNKIKKDRKTDFKKILFVGTLEERKGVIYCIELMNRLKECNYELNIIGDPLNSEKYFEMLMTKVNQYGLREKVFFRGRVTDEVLQNYYINSIIFLFPSLWEGYGMAVAEAMSYGLPVVGFNIPALEEIVDNNQNGFLVSKKDSEALFMKVKLLLEDEDLREKFSKSAFKKSEKFQNWEKTCFEIYKTVNNIIQ